MKDRLVHIILQNRFFNQVINLLQRIKLGEAKVGLYDVIIIFIQKMSNNEILDRAKGVAFSFTVAIFPAIIFLFTLVPFIQNFFPDITSDVIIGFLKDILPTDLYSAAETTIHGIMEKNQRLLSVGFLLAFFLSTNGMINLMRAFNKCYKTKETRGDR